MKRGTNPNSLKALRAAQMKPGMPSRNPGGMTSEQHALRRLISEQHGRRMQESLPDELWRELVKFLPGLPRGCTVAHAMTYGQAVAAIKGSTSASTEITDRLEGKVKQQIDVRNIGALDDETLDNRIAELLGLEKAGQEKPS